MAELQDVTITSSFFPPLSSLCNGRWENAPSRTALTASNVAYIFYPLAINASGQNPSPGLISLGTDPHYPHKLYWRIPGASLGGMLSAVALRAVFSLSANNWEVEMIKALRSRLTINKFAVGISGKDRGRGEDEEGRGGRQGKGQRGTQKRVAEEGNSRITYSSKRNTRG